MNRKIYRLLLASLILSSPKMYAQTSKSRNNYDWQLGIQGGLVGYHGDIGPTSSNLRDWKTPDRHPSSFGTSLTLENRFSSAFGLALSGFTGSFTANDRAYNWDGSLRKDYKNFDRALNCRTEIVDVAASLVYHFDNNFIIKRNAKIAPFASVGVGYTGWRVWADLYTDKEQQRYYYWSDGNIYNQKEKDLLPTNIVKLQQDRDYETEVSKLHTEGVNYKTRALMIPVGLGVNFRLSDRWNFQVAATGKYLFSDYLDDVSGNKYLSSYSSSQQQYAANPSDRATEYRGNPNKWNDIYGYASVGLAYNFGMRIRKFRGPHLYSYYYNKPTISTTSKPSENPLPPVTPIAPVAPITPTVPQNITITNTTTNLDSRLAEMEKDMEVLGKTQVAGDDSLGKEMQKLRLQMIALRAEKEKKEQSAITPVNDDSELTAKFADLTRKMDSLKVSKGIVTTAKTPNVNQNEVAEEIVVTQNGDEIEEVITKIDEKGRKKVIRTKRKVEPSTSNNADQAKVDMLMKRIEKLEAQLKQNNNTTDDKPTRVEKATEKLELRRLALENKKLKLEQRKLRNQNLVAKTPTEQAAKDSELKEIEAEMSALNLKMDSVSTAVADISKQDNEVRIIQAPSISAPSAVNNSANLPTPVMSAELAAQLGEIQKQLAELKNNKSTAAPVVIEKPVYIEKGTGTTISTPDYSSSLNRLESKLDQLSGRMNTLESKPNTTTTIVQSPEPQTKVVTQNVGLRKINVYFANGKADISRSDMVALDELAKAYSNGMSIMIRGYASSTGKATTNQKLSESRAKNVRNYLIKKGIPVEKIATEYFGSTLPVFNSELDRRVEIELLMQ